MQQAQRTTGAKKTETKKEKVHTTRPQKTNQRKHAFITIFSMKHFANASTGSYPCRGGTNFFPDLCTKHTFKTTSHNFSIAPMQPQFHFFVLVCLGSKKPSYLFVRWGSNPWVLQFLNGLVMLQVSQPTNAISMIFFFIVAQKNAHVRCCHVIMLCFVFWQVKVNFDKTPGSLSVWTLARW